ncbi:FG-GAP-like repeat-containing protein [Erythrobacter sp. F6033]|uniref:FG-GAP-like repeat-containing protein n=1 Tax=Erythrobacter sp. F6033 TaxID=2926401 RepID=UPI001FF0FE16|nr:FG-GAP-like repeat-containing protein [Erythrobacter sp. F6033]MCK0127766.1 FG-GAP-like repeat-containing protein [Erythrobacter sp. F6033]
MTGPAFAQRFGHTFLERNGRLILSGLVMAVLVAIFWTGSRYPALNEKALMGGDTPMSGLAFDIVLDIFPNSPVWWEFTANVANWIVTNWKGMTFGVLFGAALLTLLSVVKRRSFKNGFANAALGAAIGAPLGVCVNCAAPIALGLHVGRMRLETTLAALIASPTLNVIVVGMSFALLPMHVAATKLLLSLTMILLIVPLLCRYWLKDETAASGDNIANLAKVSEARGLSGWIAKALTPQQLDAGAQSVTEALLWYARAFGRNLFFIGIITVPMMFLAALLAAAIATGLDTGALASSLPTSGVVMILLAMIVLAIFATFAPAPIALDVILTAVLLGIGLSTEYATVLVIALGTFSIYAFLVLWRAVSMKTAATIFVATIALAVVGGVIAKATAKYEQAYDFERTENYLLAAPKPILAPVPSLPDAPSIEAIAPLIEAQQVNRRLLDLRATTDRSSAIKVYGIETPDAASDGRLNTIPENDSGEVFTRVSGQNIGLEELGVNTPLRELAPEILLGGIAAGDIHGDGWIDVVTRRPTGTTGLSIYANIGGRFQRQDVELGGVMASEVLNVALADLDNDMQLDLVVSTKGDGVFVFFNENGSFDVQNQIRFAIDPYGLVMSFSFADMDADGDLDIILGRWAHGSGREGWSRYIADVSANQIAWNEGERIFSIADLAGSGGQTLATLVSDFDGDGQLDLLKGDDVAFTDQLISFSNGRKTEPFSKSNQPFPYFMRTSMSFDVGDYNNDLRRDYYGGQISNPATSSRDTRIGNGKLLEVCQQFGRDNDWNLSQVRACAAELKSVDQVRGGEGVIGHDDCGITQRLTDTTFCFAMKYQFMLLHGSRSRGDFDAATAIRKCKAAFARLPQFLSWCDSHGLPVSEMLSSEKLLETHAPGIAARNILMTATAEGLFEDVAQAQNVHTPGWTWNSRFADLDQDGWQDLFVTTGSWLSASTSTTNVMYHNNSGRFADATNRFGLYDVVPSYSYVLFDFDRDNDIDIIRDASSSRMIVHRNDRPRGKALWVRLRDKKGSSYGVGATVYLCTSGAAKVEPKSCQMRDIKASGGYQSFDPIGAHFGLRNPAAISLIEVHWADGEVTTLNPEGLTPGEIEIWRD